MPGLSVTTFHNAGHCSLLKLGNSDLQLAAPRCPPPRRPRKPRESADLQRRNQLPTYSTHCTPALGARRAGMKGALPHLAKARWHTAASHCATGQWDAQSWLHDHNDLLRHRSTASSQWGHHLRPRSRPPAARGGGGGGGERANWAPCGRRGRTARADPTVVRRHHWARLTSTAPLPGPSNRHARSGLGPRRRHPCRSYGLCWRSAPTVAWRGGEGGVVTALGLESLPSRPRSDAAFHPCSIPPLLICNSHT
jgi:hypothetical protein